MPGLKKGTILVATGVREVREALRVVSKAALADALAQQIALNEGHCDDPISLAELSAALVPVLEARRDRIPSALLAP